MQYEFHENDPNARIIKLPCVGDKANWPKAPSKYIFVFEAINLVGSAISPQEWTGRELHAVSWPVSPQSELAMKRLPKPVGGGAGRSGNFGTIPVPRQPHFEHLRDWNVHQRQQYWESNRKAIKRLCDAVNWLAQKCRDEELVSFARLRDAGGMLFPMLSLEWNIDNPLSTFVSQGGKKRYFMEFKNTGPFESYVFFERDALQQLLARQPETPLIIGEADLSQLSPYLRLAVNVALKRGYFADKLIDAAPAREAEVEAVWADFLPDVPMTPAGVKQLAKLMGFPDPEAIKQGQRGGQRRKSGGTPKV